MSPIVRIGGQGEGVAVDGRCAPFAAPGDMLADDGSIVAGPHHQTPPCRHFPQCGGCQLQHLDDESYAGFITDRIAGALAGQGLSATLRPVALSPPNTRRRARLHAEKGGRLGFSETASHAIVDITECHILAPALFALVAPLRALLARLKLKRRVDVHLTLLDQGADVLVTGTGAEGLAAAEAITAFCERHRIARFAVDDGHGPETRWEPEGATVTLGGVAIPFPHAAFLQATREGEAGLVAAVRETCEGAGTVADLFAGLGTFALAMPGRVYAAEGDRDAACALKAAINRVRRSVFVEHRDLFRRPLTVAELDRFDAVVIDPPRAGAREQMPALAATKVARLAYVSCNPATFARDAKTLVEGGWRLDWIQPVGQFRWSTHIELAASFSRQ
ncbi:MAG TPA: class I SAM-dependent RNA methyltransferase [Sphingomonas sp.]|jgi:23S rRNA (uracil1939-C5)-methyltransferase|nr:class I SAM-dependent RNA methyltransferase [Sphingomonas sp.]